MTLGQPPVGLGVDAAHEERRHRSQIAEIAARRGAPLEARQESTDDFLVALEAEDQCDVDIDTRRKGVDDRGEAFGSARDLDHHVRASEALPQLLRLLGRRRGVVREIG